MIAPTNVTSDCCIQGYRGRLFAIESTPTMSSEVEIIWAELRRHSLHLVLRLSQSLEFSNAGHCHLVYVAMQMHKLLLNELQF